MLAMQASKLRSPPQLRRRSNVSLLLRRLSVFYRIRLRVLWRLRVQPLV